MDIHLYLSVMLSLVGRGICDRLITCPKKSYQVSKKLEKAPVCEAAKDCRGVEEGKNLFNDAVSRSDYRPVA
jgi:hypothetical protein